MVHIARSNNRNNSFSREKNLIVAVINNPNLLNQIDEEFSKEVGLMKADLDT